MFEDAVNYGMRNNNLFSDTDKFYNAIPMPKRDTLSFMKRPLKPSGVSIIPRQDVS